MKKRNEIGTRLGALLLASSMLSTVAGATGGQEEIEVQGQVELTATQGQDDDPFDTLEILSESQTMTLTALVTKNDSTYKTEIPEGDGEKVEIFDIDGDDSDDTDDTDADDDIQADQTDDTDDTDDDDIQADQTDDVD